MMHDKHVYDKLRKHLLHHEKAGVFSSSDLLSNDDIKNSNHPFYNGVFVGVPAFLG